MASAPPAAPPASPSTQVQAARTALAARYRERNMEEAAVAVENGAWDNEPFMLALVDVQPA